MAFNFCSTSIDLARSRAVWWHITARAGNIITPSDPLLHTLQLIGRQSVAESAIVICGDEFRRADARGSKGALLNGAAMARRIGSCNTKCT